MGELPRAADFEDLLARYYGRLTRFAQGLLDDEHHALDVAQEVFVAAWRARQRQAPPFTSDSDEAGVRRWLYRVAYNRAISLLRHQRRRRPWDSLERITNTEEAFYSPNEFEDQLAEAEVLRSALARLGPDDAAAVLLHVIHGFTAWEIAQILDISPAAATKRVWRAKERLRAAYFAQQAQRAPVRE
jgi:RNA polymerase sigma-70 factor (ECF subfamily)